MTTAAEPSEAAFAEWANDHDWRVKCHLCGGVRMCDLVLHGVLA